VIFSDIVSRIIVLVPATSFLRVTTLKTMWNSLTVRGTPPRQLFPDKIFSLTFPWFLVKSLTFPWQLWSSLTFPGFPDKWSPCILVKATIAVDSDSGCLPRSPGQPQHHKYQNRIWWWQLTANRIDKRRSVRVSVGLQVSASFQIFAVRIWQLSTLGHAFGAPVRWVPVGILPWRLIRKK